MLRFLMIVTFIFALTGCGDSEVPENYDLERDGSVVKGTYTDPVTGIVYSTLFDEEWPDDVKRREYLRLEDVLEALQKEMEEVNNQLANAEPGQFQRLINLRQRQNEKAADIIFAKRKISEGLSSLPVREVR